MTTGEGPPRGVRPLPHVITDHAELRAAVKEVRRYPAYVVDVETTPGGAHANELLWIGFGTFGCVHLVPVGHPKGILLEPEHKAKTPAFDYFPEGDKRRFTPTGKISMRMIEYTVEARYAPPPPQMYPHEAVEIIAPLLQSDQIKVGHNVKFDLMTLARYLGEIPPPPYADTILVRHVLNENLVDYALKPLIYDWFAIPFAQRKKKYPDLGSKDVRRFGLDEVARYLAKDVRYDWLMYRYFIERVHKRGMTSVLDFEHSLYPVIMDIERRGFPIDKSALGIVGQDLTQRLDEISEAVYEIVGDRFPMTHTETKRYVLFGKGWAYGQHKRKLKTQKLKVLAKTPKDNKPALTQAVLEHYATRNEVANLFLEWSILEKLRGTFVTGLQSSLLDGVVHTSFKQHGTVTGRLSAAQPNLHQIPRGSTIRDLFVAGEGHTLIVADYDQIELRCAAFLSGDENMTQIFQQRRDIHAEAAAQMLRIPVEEVDENQRQVGKTQNFGTLYGAEEERIARVAGCSVEQAAQFIRRYFRLFYGLLEWKETVLQEARDRGDKANLGMQPPAVVIPPFGRLRRLPDLYNPDEWVRRRAERQAVNAIVQGFASYIAKIAMILLYERLDPNEAHMVVQVHDEIVFRVRNRCVTSVLPLIDDTMQSVTNTSQQPIIGQIPLLVSTNTGYTWAEAKRKK
jgi:DNA polymerase-1